MQRLTLGSGVRFDEPLSPVTLETSPVPSWAPAVTDVTACNDIYLAEGVRFDEPFSHFTLDNNPEASWAPTRTDATAHPDFHLG